MMKTCLILEIVLMFAVANILPAAEPARDVAPRKDEQQLPFAMHSKIEATKAVDDRREK